MVRAIVGKKLESMAHKVEKKLLLKWIMENISESENSLLSDSGILTGPLCWLDGFKKRCKKKILSV